MMIWFEKKSAMIKKESCKAGFSRYFTIRTLRSDSFPYNSGKIHRWSYR